MVSIKTNINYTTYGHELWKIFMLQGQTAADGTTYVPLTTSGNVSWTSNTSSVTYDTSTSSDPNILNRGSSGLLYWLTSLFLLSTGDSGYGDCLIDQAYLASIISAIRDSELIYGTSSAGSDSYAISLEVAPTSLTEGTTINFKADVGNTGACTLSVNGLSAVPIKDVNGADPATGIIASGQIVSVIYDGTNFVMTSPRADITSKGLSGTDTTIITGTKGTADNLSKWNSDGDLVDSGVPYSTIYGENYIINGNFDIAQRGITFTSATTPANNDDTYLLDHWNLISDGNDAVDVSQEAITDLSGSNYAIKLDTETSKRYGIVQFLESKDAQKFKGKYVSVSFAVKSANIPAIRAAVLSWGSTADTITSDIVSSWDATPTWAANWTAENTPSDLTVTSAWTTVKIENIYVDSATVNNLALAIWTPNEETIGDIIYISQVKLEIGSMCTPFVPRIYSDELRLCKRYCNVLQGEGTNSIGLGIAYSTTTAMILMDKIVTTRADKPTLAFSGTWELYNGASVACTNIILGSGIYGNNAVVLIPTVASGLTSGNAYILRAANSAGAKITLDYEL